MSEGAETRVRALVMGLGTRMFGKERRILRSLSRMPLLDPLFLLSSWDRGEVSGELEKLGLPYRKATFGYLGFRHPAWTLKNVFFMPSLFFKVLAARRAHRARLLLFAEPLSFINALPAFLLLRWLHRARIVFYLGDIGGGTAVQRLIARTCDRFADTVIVNSGAVRDGLRAAGWSRSEIHVIYNGVDLPSFANAVPLPRESFSDWGSEHVVFGFVGQLRANKGIEDFLLAARIVSERVEAARFLVIGDCPEGSDYPDRLQERFRDLAGVTCWSGFVPDVERYYPAMDTAVVPSRHDDPAPNVNLEAMASGLPVIATAAGGSPELIEDTVTGFLVPPRDPASLGGRMIELAQNPDLRSAFGKAGQERARARFDAEANARAVERHLVAGA